MPASVPHDDQTPALSAGRDAILELGGELQDLALRYWSEGRPHDALRVAMEAAAILDALDPPAKLALEVNATVEAVSRDARDTPAEDHRLRSRPDDSNRLR